MFMTDQALCSTCRSQLLQMFHLLWPIHNIFSIQCLIVSSGVYRCSVEFHNMIQFHFIPIRSCGLQAQEFQLYSTKLPLLLQGILPVLAASICNKIITINKMIVTYMQDMWLYCIGYFAVFHLSSLVLRKKLSSYSNIDSPFFGEKKIHTHISSLF